MATGPCGINCEVCLLNRLGTCSSCGPGGRPEAERKLKAQEKMLGGFCEILKCSHDKKVGYCLSDCLDFPCGLFGEYPYSEAFLAMQRRRRCGHLFILGPNGKIIEEPHHLWDELQRLNLWEVARKCKMDLVGEGILSFQSLKEKVLVDVNKREIYLPLRQRRPSPLFKVVILSHLTYAKPAASSTKFIGLRDLSSSLFFEGTHKIPVSHIAKFFERDMIRKESLEDLLGAEAETMGDISFRFHFLPTVPIWLVYWRGDEDFPSEINFLFSSNVQNLLPPDAIWGAIHILMEAIIHSHIQNPFEIH